jgi:hypothetical protein
MKVRTLLTLLIALTSVLVWVSASHAVVEVELLPPTTCIREKGKPVTETFTFPGLAGPAQLQLINGSLDDPSVRKITSAKIWVNGQMVCIPQDFNDTVSYLEADLSLVEGENTLEVYLKEKRGGQVRIQIVKEVEAEGAAFVGPDGGVVEVTDPESELYGVKVTVPPAAMDESEIITISESEYSQDGYLVDLGPYNLNLNDFITIELPYSIEIGQDQEILVTLYDPITGHRDIGDIVAHDVDNKIVKVIMHHFSSLGFLLGSFSNEPIFTTFDMNQNRFPIGNSSPPLFNTGGYCRGMTYYALWYFAQEKSPFLNEAYNKNIAIDLSRDAHNYSIAVSDLFDLYNRLSNFSDKQLAINLQKGLKQGSPQILFVKSVDSSLPFVDHVVLVTGYSNGTFYVYDPSIYSQQELYYDTTNHSFPDYYRWRNDPNDPNDDTLFIIVGKLGYWTVPETRLNIVYSIHNCPFDPSNQSPGIPNLLTPDPNTPQPLSGIAFQWEEVTDPEDGTDVEYCICINDTESSPNEIYNNCKNIGLKPGNNERYFLPPDNIFYLPLTLDPGKEYAWNIWAIDSCGKFSDVGEWWTFTTEQAQPQEWVRLLSTPSSEGGWAIAVDSSGNSYITGETYGDLDGNINQGDEDIFVSKYDTDGNKQWTRLLGTPDTDWGWGIAVDSSGNSYITGETYGDLDGNINQGDADIFVSKYNTDGNKQWTRLLSSPDGEVAYGIAVDSSGNSYISGETHGDLDGNINQGDGDIFVSKYDTDGNKQWTRLLGTPDEDWSPTSIAVDSSGNSYITGRTYGDLDGNINQGDEDIFVSKYDTDGNKQWTRLLGTPSWDWGVGIAVDSSGNSYITGFTGGDLDGNINQGGLDIFVSKYDAAGNKQWTRLFGTGASDSGYGISLDSSSNCYITGSTSGDLDGNINQGDGDIFVSKYDAAGNKQWTRLLGTPSWDWGWGIAVDSNGNSYITGETYGDLDGNINQGGSGDIFIWKLPSSM